MEYNLFEQILSQKAKGIQIELNSRQIELFYKYMELLIEWNERINLTAITNPEEIITKHFVDSLTIQKHIEEKDFAIDIGTGAGFPGIPLKIFKQELTITLLDSLNKRINFLEKVISQLELKNVKGIHDRAEELARNMEHREKYDIAVSRAVSSLHILLEYMAPLVKVEGKLICMKGPKLEEELRESKHAISLLGLKVEKIEKINLPGTDMERNILIIKKKERVGEIYPRKWADIKKRPL